MKRTRKLVTVAVLAVAVVVSAITAAYALSANTTETYAYLPEHSVYFYDTAGEYAWASSEVDTLAVAGVIEGGGTHLFYPGNAITRAEFIVMLDRAYGMSEALDNGQVNSNGSFVDVPSSCLLQQGGYRGESLRHSGGHCDRRVSAAAAYHSSGRNGVPQAHD